MNLEPVDNPQETDDDDSLAAAINEEVVLCAPDPDWATAFERERDRLHALLPGTFLQIQHIGSTAVPGLLAKPVIDILAGVRSLEQADALVDHLCRSGYTTSKPFNATLTDRRWLMRSKNGRRTHHLHIAVHGGTSWTDRLSFREALRHDPALARRHAELKIELAARHRSDREAYTQAKTEFVQAAIQGSS